LKKLAKYMKPFVGMLIAALILLLGQAVLDLNLPNMMSDIVNVGIQKGGIEEISPQAVSSDMLDLLGNFITEEDKEFVQSCYLDANDLQGEEWEKFLEKWPNAAEIDTRYQKELNDSDQQKLDDILSRSMYAVMDFATNSMKDQGQQEQADLGGDSESGTLDTQMLEQFGQMLPMIPKEQIEASIDTAASMSETMTSQTAGVFVKSFYVELGADTDSMQTQYILLAGGKMLLMSLGLMLCSIGVGFFASRTGAGVARDLRRDIFRKVTSFSSGEFDHFSTASLITRSTNDVTQIQMLITMGLRMVCYAPILGIGGTFMALSKSSSMAWVIALAVIILLGVIFLMLQVAMPKFKKMQNLIDRLNLVSRENLSGMMVIRAFATQDFEEERFDTANKNLTANTLFVSRVMVMLMPVMMLVMNGVTLLIIWVGSHQIEQATMQVGDMMAFMQYAMQIIMSFLMISMMFVMIPRASVSADRVAELLESKCDIQDAKEVQHFENGRAKGEVTFHDVSFAYGNADENVLEHISFTARPGQTTAFIGSTGSGKSTLVNLIPRFYDVTSGSITIDGIDIRNLSQHELRENIGYVPQKGILLSGDIRSNLAYGVEHAEDQELEHAADTAQATEFISQLPNGFDTEIAQGGTNVSGGQRQRLSIARALVKKAPICIFDDSFSALDFKTDAKLRAALKTDTADATVLIVAQRVSTIMHAEQIIVLDEGKIMGIGTHKELLQNCPTYREIAESQLSKEELA
jgi:ATP-binding cassette subfamily B multidrug efflux pump